MVMTRLVKQLQRQNNLQSSQALIDLGQQLMSPKAIQFQYLYASNPKLYDARIWDFCYNEM
jgi:hypothetical protein